VGRPAISPPCFAENPFQLFFTKPRGFIVSRVRAAASAAQFDQPNLEMNMKKHVTVARLLALTALMSGAIGTADAAVFFRTRVVVAPVVAPVAVAPVAAAVVTPAPVVAAPVVAAPIVATPVLATTPVVAAPVVVVPVCRFVSVPVVNAWTGVTYLVSRRVCN
jgi:hypothetical protein